MLKMAEGRATEGNFKEQKAKCKRTLARLGKIIRIWILRTFQNSKLAQTKTRTFQRNFEL
jgi:hypothetical protein